MTIRRKRKPALDPEQDVGAVESTSVTLTPPSDPGENCSQGLPMPAVFLDAVNEPDELTPVGWVRDDMTVWWPEPRETIINAHRAYARLTLERGPEPSVYFVDAPVCPEGSQPQWQSTRASGWVDSANECTYISTDNPIEQGQDSLGWCRVVLVDTADHEDS